jgi:MSHA pilin protein MshD
VKTRRAQAGLSFIELVASIVIISVATLGLMLAVTSTVNRSANPMVETQAAAVAGAYLEEAMLADFCDPATTCRNECATRACSGGCGGTVFSAESGRASFDDVCDYNGLTDSGARDRNGNTIAGLSAYSVSVRIADDSAVTLGAPALSATAGQVVRIEVQVSNPSLESPVTLTGYRTNQQ